MYIYAKVLRSSILGRVVDASVSGWMHGPRNTKSTKDGRVLLNMYGDGGRLGTRDRGIPRLQVVVE